MKISIECSANDIEYIKSVLLDALVEFSEVRNKEDYVSSRYSHATENFRKLKRQQVKRRVELAYNLRQAVFDMNFAEGS